MGRPLSLLVTHNLIYFALRRRDYFMSAARKDRSAQTAHKFRNNETPAGGYQPPQRSRPSQITSCDDRPGKVGLPHSLNFDWRRGARNKLRGEKNILSKVPLCYLCRGSYFISSPRGTTETKVRKSGGRARELLRCAKKGSQRSGGNPGEGRGRNFYVVSISRRCSLFEDLWNEAICMIEARFGGVQVVGAWRMMIDTSRVVHGSSEGNDLLWVNSN